MGKGLLENVYIIYRVRICTIKYRVPSKFAKLYHLGVDEWIAQIRKIGQKWAEDAAAYFRDTLGLHPTFAGQAALLYLALHFAGLKPRITSGFRDPAKQRAMRAAWDRGDRQGLRVRPADPDGSDHCKTTLTGSPASRGIDMPSDNEELAAQIAKALGLTPGLYFKTPDPGHYSWRA